VLCESILATIALPHIKNLLNGTLIWKQQISDLSVKKWYVSAKAIQGCWDKNQNAHKC